MASIKIEFDKPDKKYTAGETVQCKLIIFVLSKFNARSLSVRFKGFAHTEWTNSNKHKRKGDEEYFRKYLYLFGNEFSGEHTVMKGTHIYHAAFKLPDNLPTNIEHFYGHIRYTVKAKYDVVWGSDYTQTVSFFVTPKIDLNFTNLKDPIRETEEEIFGCCFEPYPLQLINILPKGGYVPGEMIPITIEVDNNSNIRIDSVSVKLKEMLIFIATNPKLKVKTDKTTIKTHVFQTPIAPFQKKQFKTTIHLDPSYEYKLFDGCGIIKCEYYIKSEAVASGCYTNLINSTKLIIGTIPFIDLVTDGDYNSITPEIHEPSARPIVFNPTRPTNEVIVEQPLPSYDEIVVTGPTSSRIGWNVGLQSPSRASLPSTERVGFV